MGQFSIEAEGAYWARKRPFAEPVLDNIDRYLRACVDDPVQTFADKVVLDLGSGDCGFARLIAQRYSPKRLVSVDLFMEHVRDTAQNFGSTNLSFALADAFRLPIADRAVDVVWGSLILSHLRPLETVLAEVARVLKPSGIYVGYEPNPYDVVHLLRKLFGRSPSLYLMSTIDLNRAKPVGFVLSTGYFYPGWAHVRCRWLTSCMRICGRKAFEAQ